MTEHHNGTGDANGKTEDANGEDTNGKNSDHVTDDSPLCLGYDLDFESLYDRKGLERIDELFLEFLSTAEPDLCQHLETARRDPGVLETKSESVLLIDLAPHLEDFIAHLFGIEDAVQALARSHHKLAPLYSCKRLFVQRQVAKKYNADAVASGDGSSLRTSLEAVLGPSFGELAFAEGVNHWLRDPDTHAALIETAEQYAAWALYSSAGQARHGEGVLFRLPEKIDAFDLVPKQEEVFNAARSYRSPKERLRQRDGFSLTDPGAALDQALDHAHYCIFCHNQGKDSCSHGLKDRDNQFRDNAFGEKLAGCPLEEKISEMNLLKSRGYPVGALAVAVVDNPMLAGTGHRICNDCMKSCIYQKQQPVDIPQIETRTLKDVLGLPWGFEIYGLLTRWNPLNLRRYVPRPETGRHVLVAGLGPAGYTLAHHLLNDGHNVFAIDGLKIEPLDSALSGVQPDGSRCPFVPVRDVASLREDLGSRIGAGFGGVAEYGITVRWDKNYLKIIRLLLERRSRFAMFGGVRFGGAVTVDNAFEMGFDHIALCLGAGKPTFISMPNGLAPGVRQASDFLMALQLTGAARADSVANLQLRLPVVVVGGGLTAIDTATEALAYYPLQVEQFRSRYTALCAARGVDAVRAAWGPQEAEIADEFLDHAQQIAAERTRATQAGEKPRLRELIESWGGVSIVYRRRLVDSPSYTLNHEEVAKALEEGIRFADMLSPVAVEVDDYGHAEYLRMARKELNKDGHLIDTGDTVTFPARAILVAAGTKPNTVLEREDPEHIALDGRYFQALDDQDGLIEPEKLAKPRDVTVITSRYPDGRSISFFGDLHPSFAGNVVKAMSSAKQGYPLVSKSLEECPPSGISFEALAGRLNDDLRARVHEVVRLTGNIVEVVLRAPAAARAFQPGQFYRLQNYETLAPRSGGTVLAMEGLAMTGAWVDRQAGLISTIVLEMGGSSDLCALLQPGEPCILMGPTGTPTVIPQNETILLAGGGLGNAVLFSIGQAMRARGCRVLYFAGYKSVHDRYKIDQIEAAADQIVWCCDEEPGFAATRPHDRSFVGNIVAAMVAYATGDLGETGIALPDVDRIIAIGSDGMMAAVAKARHDVLSAYLSASHVAIGSINSPMQCMMKEICAQCLQTHRDSRTGEETVVFSCFNQDQDLDRVDFGCLRDRLSQNATQEKLTSQWVADCLANRT